MPGCDTTTSRPTTRGCHASTTAQLPVIIIPGRNECCHFAIMAAEGSAADKPLVELVFFFYTLPTKGSKFVGTKERRQVQLTQNHLKW